MMVAWMLCFSKTSDIKKDRIMPLTMETLSQVDGGKLAAAFEAALKRVVLDCKDRRIDRASLNLERSPSKQR